MYSTSVLVLRHFNNTRSNNNHKKITDDIRARVCLPVPAPVSSYSALCGRHPGHLCPNNNWRRILGRSSLFVFNFLFLTLRIFTTEGKNNNNKARALCEGMSLIPWTKMRKQLLSKLHHVTKCRVDFATTSSMLTNLRDAFGGQSRSPNIVPFHMLGIVSYCAIVTFSLFNFFFVIYDIRLQKMLWPWNGVKGYSRSLRVVSFDRLCMVSY